MSAGNTMRAAWSDADRRRYAEGDRLRASTVPSRRRPGPSADEWCGDEDDADLFSWRGDS